MGAHFVKLIEPKVVSYVSATTKVLGCPRMLSGNGAQGPSNPLPRGAELPFLLRKTVELYRREEDMLQAVKYY